MPPGFAATTLLELQPAIAARTLLQRLGAATRGTRIAAQVDLARSFALEHRAPITAQNLGDSSKLILLDQEVRFRPSTFTGTRWTSHESRNARGQTTITQAFHFRDRSGHRRYEREAGELLLSFI